MAARKPTETQLVAAAAAKNNVEPDALLSVGVYEDSVAIVLPSHQKLVYNFDDLLDFFSGEDPESNEKPKKTPRTAQKRATTRKK